MTALTRFLKRAMLRLLRFAEVHLLRGKVGSDSYDLLFSCNLVESPALFYESMAVLRSHRHPRGSEEQLLFPNLPGLD